MEQEGYQLLATKKFPPKLYSKLSLLLPTSGSTEAQVASTQQNLEANAVSIAKYLKINAEERPVTSLYYSYGLSVINSHLIKEPPYCLPQIQSWRKSFGDF